MARSVDDIQQEIIDAKNAEAELSDLNSPSATAIWRLWTRITAIAINTFEQLIDLAIVDMEQIAREAVAGTPDWLQKRVLEFQYSETDPQVITIVDGRAAYPVLDESLRIVTRAAVKENANGRVTVKVAKGEDPLEPLVSNELNALKGYVDKIGFVGVPTDVISLNADRLKVTTTIFYSGEYVETEVKENVKTAIDGYLASISYVDFNGKVIRENLINAIQAVEGVTGIDTLNTLLNGRPEQDPLGGASNVNIVREYETAAGYVIAEDTSGSTLDDTLTLILGNG